jgi:hypothetical protein
MSLFQKSVEKKYLSELDSVLIDQKYKRFQDYFGNPTIQANIRNAKEEQYRLGNSYKNKTYNLIPLCHPRQVDSLGVSSENGGIGMMNGLSLNQITSNINYNLIIHTHRVESVISQSKSKLK